MKRIGSAAWEGGLKEGHGVLSTESGALARKPYSYKSRFEEGEGTNPEELVGAAHAGCFSMALAGVLEEAGVTPEQIATAATVTIEPVDGKPTVTKVHLEFVIDAPGASEVTVMDAAAEAKANCPVSRLLNAKITMQATLQR